MLTARLLIHPANGARAPGGVLARALHRLFTVALGALQPVPMRVQVDDLQGRPVVAAADVHTLIDVPLAAGTYHVSVYLGERQRRYTVTMEQGATVELHLRAAKEWS